MKILKLSAFIFTFLVSCNLFAQKYTESQLVLNSASGDLHGTLMMPQNAKKAPLALIIPGSGPTDRNGNSPIAQNNSLKYLAEALAEKKIASLRFDKRGIGQSKEAAKSEIDMRFEDNVSDVNSWIDLLRTDKRVGKIILIGHSEGSLIGILSSQKADAFVSIAGAGRTIDIILKEQLANIPESMKADAFTVIDSLKMGHTVNKYDQRLFSIFRPSVQPYMISWMKYNPASEIQKVKIPVLILQGNKDLQVSLEDARILAQNKHDARFVTIPDMNHVLKSIKTEDRNENFKSYNNPDLAIDKTLTKEIIKFIKKYGK